MLDIDVILNDTDIVKKSLESKGFKLNIELVKKLSSERKKLITLKESLAAEKNSLTEKFKNIKSNPEKEDLKNRSKELETEINKNKNSLKKIEVCCLSHCRPFSFLSPAAAQSRSCLA